VCGYALETLGRDVHVGQQPARASRLHARRPRRGWAVSMVLHARRSPARTLQGLRSFVAYVFRGGAVSEADAIAEAQAALERRRGEMRAAEAPRGGLAPAAAILGALDVELAPVPPVARCACGARMFGRERERGRCDLCADPSACSPLRARVPEVFRWADLEAPLVPPDSEAPVVLEDGRLAARSWLDSGQRLLTIVAEVEGRDDKGKRLMIAQTGAGKTTLAAGVANAWAARGLDFEWISCRDLNPQHGQPERAHEALRRATRAKQLIFDGLGKELGGAGEDAAPGVAVQRKLWMGNLIEELHEATGRTCVFTLDLTSSTLQEAYGSNAFRRLARNPHGTVIRLRRIADMSFDRF
jgi:hypothetical protein